MRFAFLAGLPRSGSTLISALLNQRNDVHVTGLSDASEIMRYVALNLAESENYRAGETMQRAALLRGVLPAMYASAITDLVIDKGRMWGTPFYRQLLTEALGQPPQILSPTRPLSEIVASFVRMCRANPDNYIDRAMVGDDFLPYWRKPIDDARVDWILAPGGHLSAAMLSLYGAFQPDTADQYHVVEYAKLCNNTREVLAGIERFLDLDPFTYDLDGITGQPHHDAEVYGIPNMHHVRERIQRIDPAPETILSPYALARCELEDFWS